MQRLRFKFLVGLMPYLLQATLSANVSAQNGFPVEWNVAGPADWSSPENWQGGLTPLAAADEYAVINNNGSAFVEGEPVQPGGVILGRDAGQSGALEIRTGGHLVVVADTPTNGAVVVGQNGTGTLTIQSGGQLTAASISLNNAAGSAVTLNGASQLNVGTATLNGRTNIVGQGAVIAATQGAILGAASRTQIDVTASSAPLIKAGLGVVLGGTLEVEFTGGTPAVGTTWNLFDAGAIGGQFAQITLANGSLGLGQRLSVRQSPSPSSVNGVFGQLVLEQLLVLEVNRDNGAVRIFNPSSSTPINIDGYSITSSHDSFNAQNGVWNSLTDQGNAGWIEANPKPTQLNEFKTTAGLLNVAGGGALNLGSPWQPQYAALGQNREDVVFRYTTSGGEVITAPVVYTGVNVNDVALIVDPATGSAQLRNASGFTVGIEGYSILSAAGSLTPNGWTSLDDSPTAADWIEANPQATQLSEIKTIGIETLTPSKAYNLGQIFDVADPKDLVFQYYAAGQTTPTLGRVVYSSLPSAGIPGDFDGNGQVDGADFLVWQRGFGAPYTAGDLANWKAHFGAGSATTSASAIPEPASLAISAIGAGVGAFGRRRAERNA